MLKRIDNTKRLLYDEMIQKFYKGIAILALIPLTINSLEDDW